MFAALSEQGGIFRLKEEQRIASKAFWSGHIFFHFTGFDKSLFKHYG